MQGVKSYSGRNIRQAPKSRKLAGVPEVLVWISDPSDHFRHYCANISRSVEGVPLDAFPR